MKLYKYTINDAEYDVRIRNIADGKAQVEVNGIPFDVQMHGSALVEENLPESQAGEVSAATATASAVSSAVPTAENAAPVAAVSAAPGVGTPVKAPLPGVVTKVLVSAGQTVKKGDTVLVLEAMKMENNITAECDGNISSVCCAPGDSVMEGVTLLTIA